MTDKTIRLLTTEGAPQKFVDEKGLYLYVTAGGLKSWRYDYRIGGKRAAVTFGKYPDVSLANARKKHLQARTALANGGDPVREKKVEKLERQNRLHNTFDDMAVAWFDGKEKRRSAVSVDSLARLRLQNSRARRA